MILEPPYFDIAVIALLALLSIKGAMQGFFLPLGSFLGIVLGIYLASRYSQEASTFVEQYIYPFQNDVLSNLVGFLLLFVLIWLSATLLGAIFAKISHRHHTITHALLGFSISFAKYFIIASLIVRILTDNALIGDKIKPQLQQSLLYPYMHKVSLYLLHSPQKVQLKGTSHD